LAPTTPASKAEKLNWEKELLGLFVTSHPIAEFKKVLEDKVLPLSKITQDLTGKIVRIGGIISSIKKIITKNGKPMLFTQLEDENNKIEVVVFPGIIEKNQKIFQENKIVMIKGKVDNRNGVPKVICEEVEEILEEG
jgi:DNA polymerase-3 subunit alpha